MRIRLGPIETRLWYTVRLDLSVTCQPYLMTIAFVTAVVRSHDSSYLQSPLTAACIGFLQPRLCRGALSLPLSSDLCVYHKNGIRQATYH